MRQFDKEAAAAKMIGNVEAITKLCALKPQLAGQVMEKGLAKLGPLINAYLTVKSTEQNQAVVGALLEMADYYVHAPVNRLTVVKLAFVSLYALIKAVNKGPLNE